MTHSKILLNDGSSAVLLNDGTSYALLNEEGPAHDSTPTSKSFIWRDINGKIPTIIKHKIIKGLIPTLSTETIEGRFDTLQLYKSRGRIPTIYLDQIEGKNKSLQFPQISEGKIRTWYNSILEGVGQWAQTTYRQLVEMINEPELFIDEQFKPPKNLDHRRTLTTRKTLDLERELTNKLTFIINQIKSRLKGRATLDDLRREFGQRVNQLIMATVTSAYIQGVEFVRKLDDSFELTSQDLQKIAEQANQYEQDFWTNINEELFAKQANQEPERDVSLIAGIIAGLATFGLLAIATRDKIRQHNLQIKALGGPQPEAEIGLYWITERDDRVCPICRSLDGKVVKDDEQFFLEVAAKQYGRTVRNLNGPPAHVNCRCRVLPWKNGKVFMA